MSDDGRHALTAIVFLGSVFSPAYYDARREGPADPLRHCAINLALYGPAATWVMTEHGQGAPHAAGIQLGGSRIAVEGDALVLHVDERSAPFPWPVARRVRGVVRLHSTSAPGTPLALAPGHGWWPVAPRARIEVALEAPALRWSGHGYHDANRGDGALDEAFRRWDWSRATSAGETRLHYDVETRDGATRSLALRCADGEAPVPCEPLARRPLPSSRWGVARCARGSELALRSTLEDTPFYVRSLLEGGGSHAVHEALSLERFRADWVRFLLPFRMRRGP